jgi:hypothetical protein
VTRREAARRFAALCRERLERMLVEMPEERAQDLIGKLREHGYEWEADRLEQARLVPQTSGNARADTGAAPAAPEVAP